MSETPAPPPADGEALSEDAGLAAERERLSRQLRDTRVQLAMTQTRLSALEQSSTMKFGRTIANAAKKPWPRGALLPRDLYKLWRLRGAPKSGAQNAANALAQAELADLRGNGGRFLSALTPPGALSLADPALALAGVAVNTSGLVVTGAISALGCATIAPDAVVHPLLPHDADIVVEATGADLVLIQASALLPGEPWAYATDPSAADRGAPARPDDRHGPGPRQARRTAQGRAALADARHRLARRELRRGPRRRARRATRPLQPPGRDPGPADRAALRRGARSPGGAGGARAARLADRRRRDRPAGRRPVLAVTARAVPGQFRFRYRVRRAGTRAGRERRPGDRAPRVGDRRRGGARRTRGSAGRAAADARRDAGRAAGHLPGFRDARPARRARAGRRVAAVARRRPAGRGAGFPGRRGAGGPARGRAARPAAAARRGDRLGSLRGGRRRGRPRSARSPPRESGSR